MARRLNEVSSVFPPPSHLISNPPPQQPERQSCAPRNPSTAKEKPEEREERELAEALEASRETGRTDRESELATALNESSRFVQPIDLRQAARTVKPTSAIYSSEDFTKAQEAVEDALTEQYKCSQGNKSICVEALELSAMVRSKNGVSQSEMTKHSSLQYGRIYNDAMFLLLKSDVVALQPTEVFLDIGHGLGLQTLLAAYCFGSESRGIELDEDRYLISLQYRELISTLNSHVIPSPAVGSVDLRLGNAAESSKHLEYITTSDVVFVNNYANVYAKSDKIKTPSLDKYIAGYFAQSKIGTRLISLSQVRRGMGKPGEEGHGKLL